MAVLRETIPFQYKFSEATAERPGILGVVEGLFQRADAKNANGRIYSRGLFERILEDADVRDRLNSRAMVGELDHPQSGTTAMSRISHVVVAQKLQEDGAVHGVAEILDTPMGKILETLFRAKIRVGVSSRGDGTVTIKGGTEYVNESDYKLETYDFVIKPSTLGAYPTLSEEERTREGSKIVEAVRSLVNSSSDPRVLLESSRILSSLGTDSAEQVALMRQIDDRLVEATTAPSEVPSHGRGNMAVEQAPTDTAKLESLVRDLAEKRVTELEESKGAEIGRLNERVVALSEERDNLARRYGAAKKILESLLEKRAEITESLNQARAGRRTASRQARAAKQLLGEAVKRLKGQSGVSRRYEAARTILCRLVEQKTKQKLAIRREKLLAGLKLSEAQKQGARGLLNECSTYAEMDARVKQLSGLLIPGAAVKPKAQVQGLPGASPKGKVDAALNESATRSGNPLIESLTKKFDRIRSGQ